MSNIIVSLHERLHLLTHQVWQGCTSLRGSPSELWKAYTLKFLDSYAYFSLSLILTLFLSDDFGYTDVQAGTIYGAWGALITVYGLATGVVVDNLGVATSLRLGFGVSLVARIVLYWTTNRTMLLTMIWFVLPFGNCLGIPVLTVGIRRYTHSGNRGFAYGLFYVVMNFAALLSGPMVDGLKAAYNDNSNDDNDISNDDNTNYYDAAEESSIYQQQEWKLTGYRAVLLTGVIANIIAVLVSLTVREIKLDSPSETAPPSGIKSVGGDTINGCVGVLNGSSPVIETATDHDLQTSPEHHDTSTKRPHASLTREVSTISTFTPLRASAWAIFQETLAAPRFWRFLVVIMITLNVRMIFRHLDATLPKYMVREFGGSVPFGTIYSINPAIIIVLVPIMTAATSHVDPLVMIHYGSYISASSVFILAMSTSVTACVLFVIVLSIGEAVWSPRLYDYTMNVCEEGREGTYMALSSAPLFLAKLPVGFMSGFLLQKYCPAEGARQSKTMWLIIGATTASSPILMTTFWKYISKRDDDIPNQRTIASHMDDTEEAIRYTELAEQTTVKSLD